MESDVDKDMSRMSECIQVWLEEARTELERALERGDRAGASFWMGERCAFAKVLPLAWGVEGRLRSLLEERAERRGEKARR